MTAQDFLKRDENGVYTEQDITHAMIEFSKYHVQEALIETVDKIEPTEDNLELANCILNAYPLTNIK